MYEDLLGPTRRFQQQANRPVTREDVRRVYGAPAQQFDLGRTQDRSAATGFQRSTPRAEPEMYIYTVEVTRPDGTREEVEVEGPDGMTEADLQQLAGTPPTRDISPWMGPARQVLGTLQGASDVFDNAAELAQDAWNYTGGRVFGESQSATQANEAGGGFRGLVNQIPGGERNVAGPGRFVGETGAAALLTRGLGGPATQGAAGGLLLSEGDTAYERGRDALVGAVGGKAADLAMRGARAVVSPVVNAAARELHQRGVRLSPGQAIPTLHRTEDRLISRPFIGDHIVRRRQEGFEDFQIAALDEVVAPYNAVAPRPVNVPRTPGRSTIRSVGDQLSNRYDTLIPNLRMVPDQQLAADITAVAQNLTNGNLSPAAARQFTTIVQNQVMPHLGRGPMTGAAYRQVERRLGQQIRRFSRSTNPDDQATAEAFEQMQDAFQGALARSNPRYAQELAALNTSWRNLVRVEGAASGARNGLFTPAQFRQAVRRGDNSTRGRGMARGEAPMQQLADAADEILPSQYPDSGTSGRSQMNPFDPRYWLGAAQGALYGPRTQQLITNVALSPRPQFAPEVARALGLLPAPQAGAYGALGLTGPFFGGVP